MQLNFSLKKAWDDLFCDKKYALELFSIILLLILLTIVSIFTPLKLLPILGYIIWSGYFVLMCNNIINDKQPALADIFSNTKGRNIFATGLKIIGLSLIYGICFGLFWFITNLILAKIMLLPQKSVLLFIILISIPLVLFVALIEGLLLSENLKFSDGFNLKKGLSSFKYAWKDYLASVGFLILANFVSIFIIFFTALIFGTILGILIKSGMSLDKTTISNYSSVSGVIIGNLLGIPLGYFFNHILAQIYKYTLTKIN